MPSTELPLLPYFEQFISVSERGRRIRYPGKKLAPGTIKQSRCTQKLLVGFEQEYSQALRFAILKKHSVIVTQKEKKYWQRFLTRFLDFLYNKKRFLDTYIASVLKILRSFFNYLLLDKQLPVGTFHLIFKIPTPPHNPVILEPEQLKFLIHDKNFEQRLAPHLRRTKDIFVFGCTVGLRYCDLMNLKCKHLQKTAMGYHLLIHAQKTATPVQVPVPDYLITIVRKYRHETGSYLLPRLSSTNLNKQVKLLCQEAGWKAPLPKIRHRRGKAIEIRSERGLPLRFCDQVTAHTMRRTAITTLLIMGVPELVVRRISGHAPGSREFYRYVVIAQNYLNHHVRNAYQKLGNNAV
jgi:integrase